MTREKLPPCRACETIDFVHGRMAHVASIGRYEDGRLAEVFLSAGKAGTDLDAATRDAAIVLSLAFQYGVPVETLSGAISRLDDGSAASAVGCLLDIITADGPVRADDLLGLGGPATRSLE